MDVFPLVSLIRWSPKGCHWYRWSWEDNYHYWSTQYDHHNHHYHYWSTQYGHHNYHYHYWWTQYDPYNHRYHYWSENRKSLPKARQTQGIEYFVSINSFSSKQKLRKTLISWSNFSLEIHRTNFNKIWYFNFNKFMWQLWQIHVTTYRKTYINSNKSM